MRISLRQRRPQPHRHEGQLNRGQSPLPHNPVRALGPLNGSPKNAPRALTVPRLRQLRAALSYDMKAIAGDVPDLVGF